MVGLHVHHVGASRVRKFLTGAMPVQSSAKWSTGSGIKPSRKAGFMALRNISCRVGAITMSSLRYVSRWCRGLAISCRPGRESGGEEAWISGRGGGGAVRPRYQRRRCAAGRPRAARRCTSCSGSRPRYFRRYTARRSTARWLVGVVGAAPRVDRRNGRHFCRTGPGPPWRPAGCRRLGSCRKCVRNVRSTS